MGKKITLTFLILLIGIFSVITSSSTAYAGTDNENDPEEEAEEAAERGETTVYDDNPDLDKDGTVTPDEEEKFTDAAVALGDRLNNPEEENDNDEDYTITCWNGEEVSELSDCPEDDGSITCPDGVTEVIRLSYCPTTTASSTIPFLGEADDREPNPYCDLVPDGYQGSCHDRKDYSEVTGLYPCNDGTDRIDWMDCPDATEEDKNKDEDDESSQSTTGTPTISKLNPNRFSPIGGGVYFPTESVPNSDRLKFGPFGILLPNQAGEEFGPSTTTSMSVAEESSCKILGSADGILQKFDTARYQACGLYTNGQKAYSDGFVAGCIQVGNTQLICQSLVDSSKLNVNIPLTQTPTQAVTQPTQGIQPAAVNK